MSVSLLLLFAVAGPLAVKGIEPGHSTREDVAKAFGPPVKAECRSECEYTPQLDASKLVVHYSGNTANEVEITLNHWVRRSVLEETWKLPAPDRAGRKWGLLGPWRETYEAKGLVLDFRGEGKESGVKWIRCKDPAALVRERWLAIGGCVLAVLLVACGAVGGVIALRKRRAPRSACPACRFPIRRGHGFCTRCGTRFLEKKP